MFPDGGGAAAFLLLFHRSTFNQNNSDICVSSPLQMNHVFYGGLEEGVAGLFALLIDIDKGYSQLAPWLPPPSAITALWSS